MEGDFQFSLGVLLLKPITSVKNQRTLINVVRLYADLLIEVLTFV